jgi:uncharacterized protein (DUF885 family)
MKTVVYFAGILLLVVGCSSGTEDGQAEVDLDGILDHYASESYKLNPLSATANDVNDYNNQLAIDIREDYKKEAITLNNKYLDTLRSLNYDGLTDSDKLSVDILTYQLNIENEFHMGNFGIYRPVDQFVFSFPQRFAVLGSGAGYIPFNNETDYRNFINRMKAFQVWIDQAISNMQTGLELNNANPKASMAKVPAQLSPLFENEGDQNIFYKPLQNLPDNMDSASRARLVGDYTEAINTYIRPAYKKLNDYLVTSYIPNSRESTGLIDNGNGKKEYAYWLKYYTTTDVSADEIFELGLSEVARIRNEMDSIRKLTGFKGDLKAYFQFIKTDSGFFPFNSEEQVLNRYRSFEATMEPQLKELFNMRPKAKFEVRATEKFREAGANAQYNRPSRDGIRPGIFYETVRDPKRYNYFDMESLFMHEAIPGHHYQIALQLEADIPEFRKSYFNSAFTEGWALYAESLGKTLGMYKDPYQYMGRLNNEMERAVRLVVDAGMHHKGWTREQAIAYVLDNQPVTAFVAEQRIERYMVTAGQAVSYKVGELKIIELREKAKKQLRDNFDIREFHDEVLKEGCLPLSILERQIDKWIASKRS